MNMNGKVALVTGGGRDIGGATALRLAQAGASVAINYFKSADGANKVVADIEAAGGKAFALAGDMTNQDDVDALVERTVEEFGGIDIVAHITGGIIARKKLPELTVEHWNAVMDLNVTSLLRVVRTAVPHMREGGSIVTMASQAGRDGAGPGAIAYGAAKGAIMTMTRGLAKELAPAIRVNSVCPGMINTDFHNIFTAPEVREKVAAATPLKREGQSTEVANLVAFLASDEAAFLTGVCYDINGGTVFS
ncbi:SDR family NAD(P)-dependent oxidoreductase [Devosia sp. Naph2]|uniref:SDR family NAD(P)-dependent oxidoreductase n=1 Tax=Devosia polycyclovorans TaxID=3345148 RepID=UPI0035CEB806